jgi:hypothetical protein
MDWLSQSICIYNKTEIMKKLLFMFMMFLTSYSFTQCACVWKDINGNVQCELYTNCSGGQTGNLTICANKVTNGTMCPCEVFSGMNWNCGGCLSNGACFYNGNACDADMVCTYVFLPVELISFTGKEYSGVNIITWVTASENNSDKFNLQHSVDGYTFTTLISLPASGNSNELLTYTTYHNDPKHVINYYRLKQIDFNGDNKTYEIIAIDNRLKDMKIIKMVNMLGQEVDEYYKGVVILYYDDGTIDKKIQ